MGEMDGCTDDRVDPDSFSGVGAKFPADQPRHHLSHRQSFAILFLFDRMLSRTIENKETMLPAKYLDIAQSLVDAQCHGLGEDADKSVPITRDELIYGIASLLPQGEAEVRNEERHRLLNTPEVHDFAAAAVLEALHQRERWRTDDEHKTNADWFRLIGYLAGKAFWNPAGDHEKQLHRIITVAAAAANWHAAVKARSAALSAEEKITLP